ncbi:MAG TPA: hypothetical protein VJY41_07885 [Prolixibacteraceae bacterium]|nr:hypothetical protein [Prolixibacteraceae bacterium]
MYRFAKNRKNYTKKFKFTHTVAISAEAKYKIHRTRLYYRLQYQNIDDDANNYSNFTALNNVIKTRLKVKYKMPRSNFSPYISSELYFGQVQHGIDANKLKT